MQVLSLFRGQNVSETRHEKPASPKKSPADGRSPTARAAAWVSRITTISLEMVVPGLIGYWLDLQLGTQVVLMLLGFALGMYVAIRHLLHSLNGRTTPKSRNVKQSKN